MQINNTFIIPEPFVDLPISDLTLTIINLIQITVIIFLIYFFFSVEIKFIFFNLFSGSISNIDQNRIEYIKNLFNKEKKMYCTLYENNYYLRINEDVVSYLNSNPVSFKSQEECTNFITMISTIN